jgi:hypothetical protein
MKVITLQGEQGYLPAALSAAIRIASGMSG